jgi:hypothetical protein
MAAADALDRAAGAGEVTLAHGSTAPRHSRAGGNPVTVARARQHEHVEPSPPAHTCENGRYPLPGAAVVAFW